MTGRMCFVAMPITTTPDAAARYRDEAHFEHVLEFLFRPALQLAGFVAISPVVQGTELIHAEIIRQLETADLVPCDISDLNPNVFFELGVRTALDRPVVLVRDDQTERVPFDTTLVNCHAYRSDLSPWVVSNEIAKLAAHLANSTATRNALWHYFGITSRASLADVDDPAEAKLDLILNELRGGRSQRDGTFNTSEAGTAGPSPSPSPELERAREFREQVRAITDQLNAVPAVDLVGDSTVVIDTRGYELGADFVPRVTLMGRQHGLRVVFL